MQTRASKTSETSAFDPAIGLLEGYLSKPRIAS